MPSCPGRTSRARSPSSSRPRRSVARRRAGQGIEACRIYSLPVSTDASWAPDSGRDQERHRGRHRRRRGMGTGGNARSSLITRGLAGAQRLGTALGANPTFAPVCRASVTSWPPAPRACAGLAGPTASAFRHEPGRGHEALSPGVVEASPQQDRSSRSAPPPWAIDMPITSTVVEVVEGRAVSPTWAACCCRARRRWMGGSRVGLKTHTPGRRKSLTRGKLDP